MLNHCLSGAASKSSREINSKAIVKRKLAEVGTGALLFEARGLLEPVCRAKLYVQACHDLELADILTAERASVK